MEKNILENKLFKELSQGLTGISEMAVSSIDLAEKEIAKNLTAQEQVRFRAFAKKYTKLTQKGLHKEAQELKEKYSEQL